MPPFLILCIATLLQIVLKVLRDALVQMYTLVTHHVVTFTRVGEEVGLSTRLDALFNEHEAVLRYYGWVIVSGDDLQLAL